VPHAPGCLRPGAGRLIAGPAALFAADIVAALDAEPFDAVLADGALLGALVGAEARGVRAVVLLGCVYLVPSRVRPPVGRLRPARGAWGRARDRAGFHVSQLLWNPGLRPVNEARAAYGLEPLQRLWDQLDHADRMLMLTSSEFDDPPPEAPNVRYVGPVLEDFTATDPGVFAMPPGDDPLVVVGLSTSFMDQSDLLRRITRALASLPVRGIVTTGPSIDPAVVPAAPNVAVVRSLPHSAIFPQADLVVTHAGHGTLIKAIASGVPTLCIPLGRDQHDNAARAARHGVAQVLSSRAAADTIPAAVRRMLDDPSRRATAAALGERVRAEIASGALLAELEGVAAPRATGR